MVRKLLLLLLLYTAKERSRKQEAEEESGTETDRTDDAGIIIQNNTESSSPKSPTIIRTTPGKTREKIGGPIIHVCMCCDVWNILHNPTKLRDVAHAHTSTNMFTAYSKYGHVHTRVCILLFVTWCVCCCVPLLEDGVSCLNLQSCLADRCGYGVLYYMIQE